MRRFTRNDFLAIPPEFHGPGTHGVASHPGFHTAQDSETTYAYAQTKVVPEDLDDELSSLGPAGICLDDYPVVVAIDMQGLEALTDYDAIEFVKPRIIDVANEVVRQDSEDLLAELESYAECGDMWRLEPETALGFIFEMGAPVMQDPSGALHSVAEQQDDPDEFIRLLAAGKVDDEVLAEITGQYRYVQDVSSDRIVSVHYLAPWFPRIFDCEIDDSAGELAEKLEQAGWAIVDQSDVNAFHLREKTRDIYSRSEPQGARIEYHGTSYLNLLQAAPELKLPKPPLPFDP